MSDWGDWGDTASTNGESNSSFSNCNGRNNSSRGNFSRNQTSSYSSASFGDASSSSSLKIHGFDCCMGPNEIRELFGRFGQINSLCFFYPTHTPGGNATCWLTYATSESAPTAIKKFNGRELRGRELTITLENPPFNGSSSGGDFNCGVASSSGPMRGGRMGGSRPSGCFNCNKDGHMARDCPEPKKERRGSDRFTPYPRGGGRSGGYGGNGGSSNANETPLGSGDTADGWGGSAGADDWGTPAPAPANNAPAAVPKVEETKPAPAADEGW